MTDREVMQMALDVVQRYSKETPLGNQPHMIAQVAYECIEALRTALAKPSWEPVAWGILNTRPTEKQPLMMVMLDEPEPSHLVVPLYTAPPQHESTCAECDKKQSDGWALYCVDCLREFYTAPPKKEWVGLTDVEMLVAAFQAGFDVHEDFDNEDDPDTLHWWSEDGEPCDDTLHKLRNIIEAKLKDKNI